MLIEKGADVGTRDVDGRTALHFAAASGHEAVTRLLIDKGADIEARDSDGETAQNKANIHGHTSLASLLQKQYPSHAPNQSPRSILPWRQFTSPFHSDYPSPSANQETSRHSKSLWERGICGERDHSPPPELDY
jgi:ankyrin repeat protein